MMRVKSSSNQSGQSGTRYGTWKPYCELFLSWFRQTQANERYSALQTSECLRFQVSALGMIWRKYSDVKLSIAWQEKDQSCQLRIEERRKIRVVRSRFEERRQVILSRLMTVKDKKQRFKLIFCLKNNGFLFPRIQIKNV